MNTPPPSPAVEPAVAFIDTLVGRGLTQLATGLRSIFERLRPVLRGSERRI